MISIIISTEVPKFFREQNIAAVNNTIKIPSIDAFIRGTLPENYPKNWDIIIDNMLKIKIQLGIEHLPIIYGISKSRMILPIGGDEWAYVSGDVPFELYSNTVKYVGHFIDLTTGLVYNANGRQASTVPDHPIIKEAIDFFELQPLLNWYDNGSKFTEYSKILEYYSSSIELELYRLWLDYHINKFKTDKGTILM